MQQDQQGENKEDQILSIDEILTNAELLTKVEAELRLCEERNKVPKELLQECVNELEEKGFYTLEDGTKSTDEVNAHLNKVKT